MKTHADDRFDSLPISLRLEPGLRDDLKQLADANDRTFSAEVRRALRLYVLAEKAKEAA